MIYLTYFLGGMVGFLLWVIHNQRQKIRDLKKIRLFVEENKEIFLEIGEFKRN